MIFEKYKPLILGLWALFSFSVSVSYTHLRAHETPEHLE